MLTSKVLLFEISTQYPKLKSSLSYYGYSRDVLRELLGEKSKRLASGGEKRLISELEEITQILSRMYSPPSRTLQAVDARGQDYGTYYFAAYSGTRDVDSSCDAYEHVKNLVRIVLLMDRFYEVGNQRYRRLGEAMMTRIKKSGDLKNSQIYLLKQFWPFWEFEQFTKKLMIEGHRFSMTEVRRFNLFKSSDAALIYAPLLESMMPEFTHNTSLVIHYNQALQDIEDDLDDLQEDLRDQMPNVFVLGAMGKEGTKQRFSELRREGLNRSSSAILDSSTNAILQLVNEYTACTEGIMLPSQFEFLKDLSRHYAGRIRAKLATNLVEV